jgi:hypothetical protein
MAVSFVTTRYSYTSRDSSSDSIDGSSTTQASGGSICAGISLRGWPHSTSTAGLPDPACTRSWSWPVQLYLRLDYILELIYLCSPNANGVFIIEASCLLFRGDTAQVLAHLALDYHDL